MYCIRIKIFASRLPLSTVPELIESAKKILGENPDERKVFILAEFIRGTELEMEKKEQISKLEMEKKEQISKLEMEKKEQRFIFERNCTEAKYKRDLAELSQR